MVEAVPAEPYKTTDDIKHLLSCNKKITRRYTLLFILTIF